MSKAVSQLGWAVTEGQEPADVVARGTHLKGRLLDSWHGTRKLWKVDADGTLRDCTGDEMRFAQDRAHGKS